MVEILLAITIVITGGWFIEQWLHPTPVPFTQRAWQSNVLHCAILMALFGLYMAIFQRVWLAAALALGFPLLLMIVSNVKYAHLREPFLASDWSYFTEAIRYPKLYLPYFGMAKATVMLIGFMILLGCWLWLEPTWSNAWQENVLPGLGLALSGWLIWRSTVQFWVMPEHRHRPSDDLIRFGMLGCLSIYRRDTQYANPKFNNHPFFGTFKNPTIEVQFLPHFVCVQAESFFDIKRHFPLHASTVQLQYWNELSGVAAEKGPLIVPAWGANTVRTEFAFLSGLSPVELGPHQFHPYQLTKRQSVPSIARWLKGIGYRTLFIHPYDPHFYQRNVVVPKLGFDQFEDISCFDRQDQGDYVSDLSVGQRIIDQLIQERSPCLIHAVTIAGHGPYASAGSTPNEIFNNYSLRMQQTDNMLGFLKACLPELDRPVVLCVFGDHAPILPDVYTWLGTPNGTTDYLIWHSRVDHSRSPITRYVHDLGQWMLKVGGLDISLSLIGQPNSKGMG